MSPLAPNITIAQGSAPDDRAGAGTGSINRRPVGSALSFMVHRLVFGAGVELGRRYAGCAGFGISRFVALI